MTNKSPALLSSKNGFIAQNAEYGHSGPDPPKYLKNIFFSSHRKRLTNMLQISPQPLSDHNCKSSYEYLRSK